MKLLLLVNSKVNGYSVVFVSGRSLISVRFSCNF